MPAKLAITDPAAPRGRLSLVAVCALALLLAASSWLVDQRAAFASDGSDEASVGSDDDGESGEAAYPAESEEDGPQFVMDDQDLNKAINTLTSAYVSLIVFVILYVTYLMLKMRKMGREIATLRAEVDKHTGGGASSKSNSDEGDKGDANPFA